MAKKKLLVTGAGGYISSLLLPALSEHYELVLLDARRKGGRGAGKVDPNRGDPIAAFRDAISSFYGISNNTRMFWDISNARQVIGYEPKDDSEQAFGVRDQRQSDR